MSVERGATTIEESILLSIKKLLGITEEYTVFDPDIVMHINSVFMILRQMGVGPEEGFFITDSSSAWGDFLGTDANLTKFSAVKSYMYLKVRQLFDPVTGGAVAESTNNLIKELECRLYYEAEWPSIGVNYE